MDCQEVKRWLAAQGDDILAPTESRRQELRAHVEGCLMCRAYEQRLRRLQVVQTASARRVYSGISTERIMLAVEQEKSITKQVEEMRTRQQIRMARQRSIVLPMLVILAFTLIGIPLLLLVVTIVQPDLVANMPPDLSGLVYVLMLGVQYLHIGSTLMTKDTALLVIGALVLVIMIGTWLRLMWHPQQA